MTSLPGRPAGVEVRMNSKAVALIKQMVMEAAVIAMALAMIVAFIFFGSGVWEAAPPERPPWSKPSSLEDDRRLLAPNTSGVKTSGHGYYDRRAERGR